MHPRDESVQESHSFPHPGLPACFVIRVPGGQLCVFFGVHCYPSQRVTCHTGERGFGLFPTSLPSQDELVCSCRGQREKEGDLVPWMKGKWNLKS